MFINRTNHTKSAVTVDLSDAITGRVRVVLTPTLTPAPTPTLTRTMVDLPDIIGSTENTINTGDTGIVGTVLQMRSR